MSHSRGDRVESPSDRGFEKIDKVRLESRQEDLGLGIPESAIKLEHAWAILRQHQPGNSSPRNRR